LYDIKLLAMIFCIFRKVSSFVKFVKSLTIYFLFKRIFSYRFDGSAVLLIENVFPLNPTPTQKHNVFEMTLFFEKVLQIPF